MILYVRTNAVFAAGAIGTDDVALPLMTLYEKADDQAKKKEIIYAMKGLKNSTLAIQCLSNLYNIENDEKIQTLLQKQILFLQKGNL